MGETLALDDVIRGTRKSDSLDDVLTALGDGERRRLMGHLQQLESRERLSSLARWLATEVAQMGERDAQGIYVRLYHIHAPKLDEAGLVAFDPEEETVELTERGQTVAKALD